jgi:hypothetical protein
MDFEMAIWEMTSLLLAPKKVFRSIYYHKQTKNTYHRADPSFTYLLSFFMLLTGIAWGIASTPSFASTLRLTLLFVFVHFLLVSLLVATAAFFLVGRLLGPGIQGLPGRRRQAGLFRRPADGEGDVLEFGYCFDVSVVVAFSKARCVCSVNGCLELGRHTGLLPRLGASLRYPVHSLAAHITRLLDIPLPRQYTLHGRAGLLYCHMLSRLQRYVTSPQPILST